MRTIKHRSEVELRALLAAKNRNIRKTVFRPKSSLNTEVALYLQAKGLVSLTIYSDGNFSIKLLEKAFSYFQDKRDRLIETVWKSCLLPLAVSIIGTLATLQLTSWLK